MPLPRPWWSACRGRGLHRQPPRRGPGHFGLLPFFVIGLLVSTSRCCGGRWPTGRRWAPWSRASAVATAIEDHLGSTEWLYLAVQLCPAARLPRHRGGRSAGPARSPRRRSRCDFLALVPGRGGWFSRLGSATWWYLFRARREDVSGRIPAWSAGHPVWPPCCLSTLGAALLALLLATPPVSRGSAWMAPGGVVRPPGAGRRPRHPPADRGTLSEDRTAVSWGRCRWR